MFEAFSRAQETEPKSGTRRAFVLLVSLSITGLGLSVALWLGRLGYDYRRASFHEKRLTRLLEAQPTASQVVEALREKAPLVASPQSAEELRRFAAAWGMALESTILEKHRRLQRVHVFDAGDTIYFIYFDESGLMKEFVYADKERASRRGGREAQAPSGGRS